MSREEKFFSGKASLVLFVCLSRALLADNSNPVNSDTFIYITYIVYPIKFDFYQVYPQTLSFSVTLLWLLLIVEIRLFIELIIMELQSYFSARNAFESNNTI